MQGRCRRPAGALWRQRHKLAEARPRLDALRAANDDPVNLSPIQYAQLYAATLEFAPGLILELGRHRGNSTAVCATTSRLSSARPAARSCSGMRTAWRSPSAYWAASCRTSPPRRTWQSCLRHALRRPRLARLRGRPPREAHRPHRTAAQTRPPRFRSRAGHRHPRLRHAQPPSPALRGSQPAHTELSAGSREQLAILLGEYFSTEAHWLYFSLNEAPPPYTFPRFEPPEQALNQTGRRFGTALGRLLRGR